MAKAKAELVAGTIEDVQRYLSEMGREAFEEIDGNTAAEKIANQIQRVRDAAKEDGKNFIQVDVTMKQYIGTARGNLGWTKKRTPRSDNTSSTGNREATISDLRRAQAFATKMKMKPSELLALVSEINTFGDLQTLEECLTTLEELTG